MDKTNELMLREGIKISVYETLIERIIKHNGFMLDDSKVGIPNVMMRMLDSSAELIFKALDAEPGEDLYDRIENIIYDAINEYYDEEFDLYEIGDKFSSDAFITDIANKLLALK